MRRRARMRREICSVRPPRCAAILVYCSLREWTRFLRHRIKKYPYSPVHMLSDSLRIYFFPLWRWDLFFSRFDVEFAGYVLTVALSGEKKLRIRKYPDTCGRGLRTINTCTTFSFKKLNIQKFAPGFTERKF